MSENPYEAPGIAKKPGAPSAQVQAHLLEIAKAQRFLCFVILAAIVVIIGLMTGQALNLPVRLIGLPIQLGLSAFQVIAMYRLGMTVYRSKVQGGMLAFLAILPCLGLLAMLIGNSAATKELQRHGYRVGLLGARLDQFTS